MERSNRTLFPVSRICYRFFMVFRSAFTIRKKGFPGGEIPPRRPASAGGTREFPCPLLWIFLFFIGACSAGPGSSDRAKAFQGLIRGEILSRVEPVRRDLTAGDTAGLQVLLEGFRNEISRGRDRDRYAAGVLDGDGIVAAASPGGSGKGIYFSRYELFRKVMKQRRIVPFRLYLQDGSRLMAVAAPLGEDGLAAGILVLTFLSGELADRWGITEEEFLALEFDG